MKTRRTHSTIASMTIDGIRDTPGLVLIKVSAERLHVWDGHDEGELRLSERAEA